MGWGFRFFAMGNFIHFKAWQITNLDNNQQFIRDALARAQAATLAIRCDDPAVYADVGKAYRILIGGDLDPSAQAWARSVLGLGAGWKSPDTVLPGPMRGSALSALASRGTLGEGDAMRRRVSVAIGYERAMTIVAREGPGMGASPLARMAGCGGGASLGFESANARLLEATDRLKAVWAAWSGHAAGVPMRRVVDRVVIGGAALGDSVDVRTLAWVRGTGKRTHERAAGRLLCCALDVAAGA